MVTAGSRSTPPAIISALLPGGTLPQHQIVPTGNLDALETPIPLLGIWRFVSAVSLCSHCLTKCTTTTTPLMHPFMQQLTLTFNGFLFNISFNV